MTACDCSFAFERGGDDLDRQRFIDAHRARRGVWTGDARCCGPAEAAGKWQTFFERDEWVAVVAMRAEKCDRSDDRGVELRIARDELGVAAGDAFDCGGAVVEDHGCGVADAVNRESEDI